MKAPKAYGSTYHRDGTITYWDVYLQRWRRSSQLSDRALATLGAGERDRVLRHTNAQSQGRRQKGRK